MYMYIYIYACVYIYIYIYICVDGPRELPPHLAVEDADASDDKQTNIYI